MPMPRGPSTLIFLGDNATSFLELYEELYRDYRLTNI